MKKRAIVVLASLLICVAMLFAACSAQNNAGLRRAIVQLQAELNLTTVTPEDYTVAGAMPIEDEKGHTSQVGVQWTCNSALIKLQPSGADVLVDLPDSRAQDLSYTLTATLVDKNGTPFLQDGQPFTAECIRVAPKTVSPDEGGSDTGDEGSGDSGGSQTGGTGGQTGEDSGGSTQVSTVTIDFTQQGFTNDAAVWNVAARGIEVSFGKGSNDSLAPKWFDNTTSVRLYAGNTMTVSGTDITCIVWHFATTEYDNNEISAAPGDFADSVWTGSANSVVFSVGGTSGNRRVTSIDVTARLTDDGTGSGSGSGTGTGTGTGGQTGQTQGAFTVNFADTFGNWGSGWDNSYVERAVTARQLGLQGTVEFVFSAASRQDGNRSITDRPVLAAKPGATEYLEVWAEGITSATFTLAKWDNGYADRLFTALGLEYTTDGSSWVAVPGVGFADEAGRPLDGFENLSVANLPTGVQAVRLFVTGGGEQGNQQLGITAVSLSFE